MAFSGSLSGSSLFGDADQHPVAYISVFQLQDENIR